VVAVGILQDLLRRVTGGKKPETERLRGLAPLQTDADQNASRSRMESEMAGQKERRDAATAESAAAAEKKSDQP
jgi:hypothetical protein